MKTEYKLKMNIDLTFDDVLLENEEQYEVSEDLRPTQAMQDRFLQNCVKLGILEVV